MSVLDVSSVSKQYGDKTAVDGINLQVEQGEIYGLLGANGAGKTTTMRMVLGLIYPDGGSIRYNGKPYSGEITRMLGYLPEERGLYPKVKISEQLVYLAQLKGMGKKQADANLKRWLERFGVPEYYGKRVEELSKGNQQKIQFIAAVIHEPQLIILDEAFSGLDPVNVELLKDTVKELRDSGVSILFSTHRMEHVEELCRNITILHKSKTVLKGNLRDIKNRFPKEKVLLSTTGQVEGLDSIPGVTAVTRHENGYELRVNRPEAAREIITMALGQTDVHHFEVKEPTLNEIFIKTVGGDGHE
ncbi:ABC transporter ATP-binding protein [Paenibacillus sp. YN15]|uniref:ABC transporter ATP-binding protein n=1 Tax=Paenibacillus sp. YN15 TaxID=1742774 RepID=UPI000DCEB133|nr:ABC transporter ATP-binding protein [Paenibacillus sp. YN15]RAU92000.1 sodium ABC transporter ATP-binding protein [Paenibacillus sp. YN15]